MRPYILAETNWKAVDSTRFDVAVLPWGATEAHNWHLPYATDVMECDHVAAESARVAWEKGNGVEGVRAREMDAVLHRERLEHGKKRLHPLPMPVKQLPDGAMVQAGEQSFLILQGRALQWSMAGYRKAEAVALDEALLLTPPSTLRALDAGYSPVRHPSAIEVGS